MAMKALRDGASNGILKYFLFGLLGLATGGLVLTDMGGFFRGGVAATDVAKVGKHTINIQGFDQRARQTMQRVGIPIEQAYKVGYIDEMLRGEIAGVVLELSAHDKGMKIGTDIIQQRIYEMVAPMVQDGQEPQDVLEQILRNQGMSEGQFIQALSKDIRTKLLASAIQSGFSAAPAHMASELERFDGETRDVTLISFSNQDLAVTTAPNDTELGDYYEKNKEQFASPETRDVRIIRIKDEALRESVEITDEELRATYDDSIDDFSEPERRIVAQAVVSSEADAQEIYELATKSNNLKTAAAQVTGTDSAFIPPSPFQKDGLAEEVAEGIFNANTKGAIIPPAQTPLGWHVAQLIDLEPARVKPFSEVSEALKEGMLADRLIDEKYKLASDADDMLAGGSTIEELAEVIAVENIEIFGLTESNPQLPQDYAEAQETILEEAFQLLDGEVSAVQELQDGTLYLVTVDSITPKSYKPLGEVRGELSELWLASRQKAETKTKALAYLTLLDAGEKDLAAVGKEYGKTPKTLTNLARETAPPKPLSAQALGPIFDANIGEYILINFKEGVALAKINDATLPASSAPSDDARAEVNEKLAGSLRQEAVNAFIAARQDKLGVKINRKLLDQVYITDTSGY